MNLEDARDQLKAWVKKHSCGMWTPVLEAGDGSRSDSKYGGLPWLKADESWPLCSSCERPLQLYLQLNFDGLPAPLQQRYGTGLLQLFYCEFIESGECKSEPGEASLAFVDLAKLVRVVQAEGAGNLEDKHNHLLASRVACWSESIDHPGPVEHDKLGLIYSFDWDQETLHIECKEFGVELDGLSIHDNYAEFISNSADSDKLGGWPSWNRNPNYPRCPVCQQQMQFVFQLNSEPTIPIKFGSDGRGYITQCPKHKDVVTFQWDCE
jgi:uncharacterized protein YwqG